MTDAIPSKPISEERLRNTRAWAAARVGSLSGADVIVGAIDELLQMREDWKTICEAADAMPDETSDEWQPIETAPAGVRVLTARRSRTSDWHIDAATYERYQTSTGWHMGGGFFGFGVSHWKPLPAPPSEKS